MERAVIKTGYIIKLDTATQRTWKKRFVVLTAVALYYFEDRENLQIPKATILLFSDSSATIETNPNPLFKNCFVVCSLFKNLHLSAGTEENRTSWISAINNVIFNMKPLPRGIMVICRGLLHGGNKKKYFVLHSTAISYHSDVEYVKTIQGSMPMKDAKCDFNDSKLLITLQHNREE